MPLYAGLYNYHNNPEALQKRTALADQHVEFVRMLEAREALVLGNIRAEDDSPGGEIIIRAASKAEARELFSKDPNTSPELGNWVLTDYVPVVGSMMPAFVELAES
jgi:uncharacterized protein YciI